jgi:hypothetical protein
MTQPTIPPETLAELQLESFNYFVHEANPKNGLVADKAVAETPASIAVIGLALAAYPIGVERGYMLRAEAVERTLTTLRFFWNSRQGYRSRRDRLQGLLLSFPGHGERRARVAL